MESWIACVASVSVWFRSKKRPWKGIFGFDREIKREPWATDSESIRARGIIIIIIIIVVVVVDDDDDDTYWVLLLGLLVLPPSISSLL